MISHRVRRAGAALGGGPVLRSFAASPLESTARGGDVSQNDVCQSVGSEAIHDAYCNYLSYI